MIKLNYQAVALQQIHSGADTKTGTVSELRKEKRRIQPITFNSLFKDENQRRIALIDILLAVYERIDQSLKKSRYGYYEEFGNRVLAATGVRTKEQWLNDLCDSCGVGMIMDKVVLDAIDLFQDMELLNMIRSEHKYIMLMFKYRVQEGKYYESQNIKNGKLTFDKTFEWIPLVSGNSVRGVMRRLVMKDFFERIGIDKTSHGIPKEMYHQLMTGGNLTGSTAYEDIGKREQYINLCPMIGLFGSAIGNMTIQGRMKVGALRPKCVEHGNGTISFWETIGRTFGTRFDSSKSERSFELIEPENDNAKSANQMKYEMEVFNTGTLFDSDFILVSGDELLISAFWYALKLWKEFGYVGGNSARGYGKIDAQIDIPERAEELYLNHVESVKEDALVFFAVERIAELV